MVDGGKIKSEERLEHIQVCIYFFQVLPYTLTYMTLAVKSLKINYTKLKISLCNFIFDLSAENPRAAYAAFVLIQSNRH